MVDRKTLKGVVNMKETVSVGDYAKIRGVSTQYIYGLISKGKLKTKGSKGSLRVVVDSEIPIKQHVANKTTNNETNTYQSETNQLVIWLKSEIEKKDQKVERLETELLKCKNESLSKVVEINERKDAQLQKYLEFLNHSTQQLIEKAVGNSERKEPKETKENHYEAEVVEEPIVEHAKPIDLIAYLKDEGFTKSEIKKIKQIVLEKILEDSSRFLIQNSKIYIYPDQSYDELF